MKRKIVGIRTGINFLITLSFILAACQGNPKDETSQTVTSPDDLPYHTGVRSLITVRNQESDGSSVVVGEVVSRGPGWLVIRAQNGSQPGRVIGYTPVRNGVNTDLVVKIDPELATEVMYAGLHIDAGEIGTYEFPGPDEPKQVDGHLVSQSFTFSRAVAARLIPVMPVTGDQSTVASGEETAQSHSTQAVTSQPPTPATIKVADQEVRDGFIVVEEATINGPGWLVVYSEQDGQLVEVIGFTAIQDGEHKDIAVRVDTSKVTPELYALLHTDAGQIGSFEYPGPDTPVLTDIRIVLDRFKTVVGATAMVTPSAEPTPGALPLQVIAADQPVRGGSVRVSEVVSDAPGWLGVHIYTPDGKIGSAIGSALIEAGVTRDVIVRIDHKRATGVMNAMLHYDEGKIGVWEFPGPDVPAMVGDEMVMTDFNITGGMLGQEVVLNISREEAPFLTDGQGMSLYVSLADKPDRSLCDAECHKTWLPLLATGQLAAGGGVDLTKLGITLLTNGDKQVTYSDLPLYYYAGDSSPGDTKGQGIDGHWFLSSP